jgi:hypothetical protein
MLLDVLDHPLRAVDDALDRSAQPPAFDHLHVDDLDVGRDAQRGAGGRARDRGTVRVTDRGVVGERAVAASYATRELRVLGRDAAVEDVDGDPPARAAVAVGPIERQPPLVDPVEGKGECARLDDRHGTTTCGVDGAEERSCGRDRRRWRLARLRCVCAPKERHAGAYGSGAVPKLGVATNVHFCSRFKWSDADDRQLI